VWIAGLIEIKANPHANNSPLCPAMTWWRQPIASSEIVGASEGIVACSGGEVFDIFGPLVSYPA